MIDLALLEKKLSLAVINRSLINGNIKMRVQQQMPVIFVLEIKKRNDEYIDLLIDQAQKGLE